LESGANFAPSVNLIGATNYVKLLSTVASEIYPDNFTQGITLTVTGVGGARTITYTP
jgi:type IV pilus assembly protein PilA